MPKYWLYLEVVAVLPPPIGDWSWLPTAKPYGMPSRSDVVRGSSIKPYALFAICHSESVVSPFSTMSPKPVTKTIFLDALLATIHWVWAVKLAAFDPPLSV